MNPTSLLRSATFRMALTYAGLFAVSLAILLGVIYHAMAAFEEQQIRKSILAETNSMIGETKTEGGSTLTAEIAVRAQAEGHQVFRYGLVQPDGRAIGSLTTLPRILGWSIIDEPEIYSPNEKQPGHAHFFVFGSELPDGGKLFVAQDTEALEELRETIDTTFAWVSASVVGLILLGGLATSWRFLRRIERINTAAQRIVDGALNERVPIGRNKDEFDQLSENLNRMLDRIGVLLNNQKRVTSDIAHDLRTPLTRLRQDLEQASSSELTLPEYRQVLDRSTAETDAILRTFGALLRIAEIESGEQRAGFTTVDLAGLIGGLAETYAPVAEDAGHALTADTYPDITVRGDRTLLNQMFANLLENAIRHTPDGTTVSLRLFADKRQPVCEIADNGPGIPAGERDRVFRPFYRLDESRSTPGNGLGLALVAAIAELHGATIVLDDAAPGSRFTVRFASETKSGQL